MPNLQRKQRAAPGRFDAQLTSREKDVLECIVGGLSNKETGQLLGISFRTVEVHRARIMVKCGARNAADLVRILMSPSKAGNER